jgi:hypothetical protein
MWYNIYTEKEMRYNEMLKTIGITIEVLLIAFFAWGILSWIDIISDNNEHNPQHSDLNMFVVFCGEGE